MTVINLNASSSVCDLPICRDLQLHFVIMKGTYMYSKYVYKMFCYVCNSGLLNHSAKCYPYLIDFNLLFC